MELSEIFGGLPFGFSPFSAVSGSLLDCRAKERLPKNAQTVISVLFPYYLGEDFYKNSNVSRYAVSADYHIITAGIINSAAERLRDKFPGFAFEPFVDNSPLPEVRCAVNAGLGFMGKNSLFINEIYGSWVFLGEIVTDKFFEPYSGAPLSCSGCMECVWRCPGECIGENGVERERCISFLSQKKGELSEAVVKKMAENDCAWGCDVCQRVCPHNINARVTPIKEFFETASPVVSENNGVEGRAFAWRGKEVIARNIRAIKKYNDGIGRKNR